MHIDITGGFELAMFFFNSQEIDHAVINSTGQILQADIKSKGNGYNVWDGRFRLLSMLGLDAHWELILGYAWRLINMDEQQQPNQSHSRYASIGAVYSLRHK
jgi:hypothetical protein